jgi:hypothetical protein
LILVLNPDRQKKMFHKPNPVRTRLHQKKHRNLLSKPRIQQIQMATVPRKVYREIWSRIRVVCTRLFVSTTISLLLKKSTNSILKLDTLKTITSIRRLRFPVPDLCLLSNSSSQALLRTY